MQIPAPSLETIEEFLAQKRIAMIGISRNPKDFSAALFEELRRRGYDVIPVNPNTPEAMGRPCFARVQDIQPPVDGALLMTTPEVTDAVLSDCAAAGIRRVWMYRGGGKGAVSDNAITFWREHGIQVVPGQCPFMFRTAVESISSMDSYGRFLASTPNTSTPPDAWRLNSLRGKHRRRRGSDANIRCHPERGSFVAWLAERPTAVERYLLSPRLSAAQVFSGSVNPSRPDP